MPAMPRGASSRIGLSAAGAESHASALATTNTQSAATRPRPPQSRSPAAATRSAARPPPAATMVTIGSPCSPTAGATVTAQAYAPAMAA